nr:upf0662 protein [Quercus suber]
MRSGVDAKDFFSRPCQRKLGAGRVTPRQKVLGKAAVTLAGGKKFVSDPFLSIDCYRPAVHAPMDLSRRTADLLTVERWELHRRDATREADLEVSRDPVRAPQLCPAAVVTWEYFETPFYSASPDNSAKMTDSPAFRTPLDPKEQPILDRILTIRDHLSILKQDRSTYVKSEDVVKYYNQVIEQVEQLNKIRVDKREEQNRVDTVLDDCFQLISLFFLTIGRNQEAPAVYSAISTVKRLLDHLKEAGFYSSKDLVAIEYYMGHWQKSVERGRDTHSEALLTLLDARIAVCRTSAARGPHEADINQFPEAEVKEYEQQLLQIQSDLHGSRDPHEGQTAEERYAERLRMLSVADGDTQTGDKGKVDDRFHDTYEKLLKIRNTLEQMNLTQAWSLRETDLFSYQRQLDRIDESRVNGDFLDHEGNPADLHSQRTLLYLLRKCYAFVFQYIVSSEPVSEALLPIYNQLLTLKRCLEEVKKSGGVDSPRELYPYSMKLNSIDNMKKDGKFMVGDDIPDGQGAVTLLLAECFDMAYELRNDAAENREAASDDHNGVTNGTSHEGATASA